MKPKVQSMIDWIGYAMSSALAILVGYDVSAVYSPGVSATAPCAALKLQDAPRMAGNGSTMPQDRG